MLVLHFQRNEWRDAVTATDESDLCILTSASICAASLAALAAPALQLHAATDSPPQSMTLAFPPAACHTVPKKPQW